MKLTKVIVALMAVAVVGVSSVVAAPVESIESGRTAALAKVEGFLAEKVVADQLASFGLTRDQVSARLTKLSDTQIEQLATQVDQIRAGGDIEGDTTGGGIVGAFFRQVGNFFYNIFQVLFFWRDQR
jgi:TolA-binding protein